MKTSDRGIDLIISFEGYRGTAYKCSAGVWTIGWGTTKYPNGTKVKKGDTCTATQAQQYLKNDLIKFENVVKSKCKNIELNQNQFDALVSFAYNTGTVGATMLNYLKQGNYKGCADAMLSWNKATVNGKKVELAGLTRRRKAERELFLTACNTSSNISSNKYTHEQFIKEVQSAIGAKVDGKVGKETLGKVITISKTKNNKHALVKPLQRKLNALGFDIGNVDGIYGVKTSKAVGLFQKTYNLTQDEICGLNTWTKILTTKDKQT